MGYSLIIANGVNEFNYRSNEKLSSDNKNNNAIFHRMREAVSDFSHRIRQAYNGFVNKHYNAPTFVAVGSKVVVVLFTAVVSKVSGSFWGTAVVMGVATLILYIAQWATMHNRKDAEKSQLMRICSSSYSHTRNLENTDNFYTDTYSYNKYLDYLKQFAENIETLLTIHYRTTICCSIKFMSEDKEGYIAVARGLNNKENRGQNSKNMDNTEVIPIIGNSIVQHIVRTNSPYFVSNDLRTISSKSKTGEFTCEHTDWPEHFLATLIVPIRSAPPKVEKGKAYSRKLITQVYGFVFIDSLRTQNWEHDTENSFVYQCCNFYANQIGQLIQTGMSGAD